MTEFDWPIHAEGLPVFDLNGERIGSVRELRRETGHVDIRLTPQAALKLGVETTFLDVSYADIIDVDDHAVTLREEARYLLHPTQRPDFV